MALEWMPRDNQSKDHNLHSDAHWNGQPPSVVFEKRPLTDPQGRLVPDLFVAWIRLNNPDQYNSYTTEMVKGVIAGFDNASVDRSVVAVVFTGTGPYAFCTGGNTREYSEFYSRRPVPRHGSAPDGGSTDFLPWYLGMEDAMWNCVSYEMWSAYKMKMKGLISNASPCWKWTDNGCAI